MQSHIPHDMNPQQQQQQQQQQCNNLKYRMVNKESSTKENL